MCDDDTSEGLSKILIRITRDERELGISTMIKIAHMHPTIKHDSLAFNSHHHAALPHLLPCP